MLLKNVSCHIAKIGVNLCHMASIEFDESKFKLRSRRVLGEPEVPPMIKFLVVKGLVKNESQAIIVLFILIASLVAVSVFITRTNTTSPATIDSEFSGISV